MYVLPITVHIQTSVHSGDWVIYVICTLQYVLEIFPDQDTLDCHIILNCYFEFHLLMAVSVFITQGSENPVWLRLFPMTQNSVYLYSSE